jgi:hypothetical protein
VYGQYVSQGPGPTLSSQPISPSTSDVSPGCESDERLIVRCHNEPGPPIVDWRRNKMLANCCRWRALWLIDYHLAWRYGTANWRAARTRQRGWPSYMPPPAPGTAKWIKSISWLGYFCRRHPKTTCARQVTIKQQHLLALANDTTPATVQTHFLTRQITLKARRFFDISRHIVHLIMFNSQQCTRIIW